MKFDFKKLIPHLIALVAFVFIAGIYVTPAFQGKHLQQHDITQATAAAHEITAYADSTKINSWWTNSMFGGMPSYMIRARYPNSITTQIGTAVNYILPSPANFLVIEMLGMYVLLLVLGANIWLSVLGAIAYTFCSYNMIIIPAGHTSKVLALAYAPFLAAGIILCMRGRYWIGGVLTTVFTGLELYANHVQITYYFALMIAVYVVIESISLIRQGKTKQMVTGLIMIGIASLIGAANHTTRLWSNYEYSKETIRGKSELTSNKQSTGGLDKDYAFSYSYGKWETGTLLIPNFYGGAMGGTLGGSKSETYKVMTNNGIPDENALQFTERGYAYWGELPIAGGPAYAGAIVCFLFVLGCFLVKGPLKWWLAGVTLVFITFSWGKNFFFNDFMFSYFPMFNKFRAITMILSLVQLSMVALGVLALEQLAEHKPKWEDFKKPFLISLGLTAGVALIFALIPGVFFDFRSPADQAAQQLTGNKEVDTQIWRAILSDRASLLRADAFRSVIFIVLAAGLIWAFTLNKLKEIVFYPILILLVIIDFFAVDKRYFNKDNFEDKAVYEESFSPSPIDQQILQDKSPDYRVIDLTTSFTQDARLSYYHKSLGGYHAAKLRRFQEVLEHHLSQNPLNMSVLNMLNTKYFIVPNQQNGQMLQTNPDACGNAWFVKEFKIVPNADAEIKAITQFNPKQTAFVDKSFESQLTNLKIQSDSSNTIRLTKYLPDELTYESNAKTDQLAVFSEIFYKGNQDWKAYVDGKYTPHLRADYLLRAMVVPAGKHTILFKFDPVAVEKGNTVDLITSVLMVAFLGIALFFEARRKS